MHFVVRNDVERVAVISLNRPERRNALGRDVVAALVQTVEDAFADDQVNVVLLQGKGAGFSAGADLKEFAAGTPRDNARADSQTAHFVRSLSLADKPVVCAVDGFAFGAGLMVAAAADVVITATTARWHLPEVSLGWLPGYGLTTLAVRIGPARARALCWGAEPIDGREAHRIGLADRIVEGPSDTKAVALELSKKIASLPPKGVSGVKRYYSNTQESAEVGDRVANRYLQKCFEDIERRA